MSKIICDICGTSYPETAKQCPICGSVQPGDVQRVTNEVKNDGKGSTGYTHVKAGHFTKSNVKKRTKDNGGKPASRKNGGSGGHDKDNRGLVITAIVLLLAVIGVVIYIAFGLAKEPSANPENGKITCKDLKVPVDPYIAEVGGTLQLSVTKVPENCEENVEFINKNTDVVDVSSDGLVTAMCEGEAVIEIKCGTIVKTIKVRVGTSATDTTPGVNGDENNNGENPGGNGNAAGELHFVQYVLPMKVGETSTLYVGTVPVKDITWTSDNEAVATFKDGVVTAVGEGTTKVYAAYNDKKIACTVTCDSGNSGGQTGSGGVTEDGGSGNSGAALFTGIIDDPAGAYVRKSPGVNPNGVDNRIYTNGVPYALLYKTNVTVYAVEVYEDPNNPNAPKEWCRISEDGAEPEWVRIDLIKKVS